MKRVLYLSYDGMTDPLGQSQVLPYLEGLSKKQIHFTLISFEKPVRFEQHRAAIQQRCKAANIHWIPLAYTKNPPVFSTLKDIRKMGRLAFKLHKEKPFDLVHCRSYVTELVGISLKRKRNIPLVFDMRGFWADERVEGNIWDTSKPLYRFIYNYFKKKEKSYFTESDAIISLTEAGKKEILSWDLPEVSASKITVIPCCVDTEHFNEHRVNREELERIREKYQLENKYVVGYVGSIGTWYLLPEMFIVFKRIKLEKPEAVFVFLTQENPQIIFEEAQNQGLTHDDFRSIAVNRPDMPTYLSLFDSSIFFIKPSFSKKASSPTKQGELMAMGIPIICNAQVGDTAEILNHYHGGMVVPDMDLETLANFKLDFNAFKKTDSIAGAQAYFGLAGGVANYFQVYSKLWDKK